jgi:hypothetical protein
MERQALCELGKSIAASRWPTTNMGGIVKKRIEWHKFSGWKNRCLSIVRVQSADHVFYGVPISNLCWHLGIL